MYLRCRLLHKAPTSSNALVKKFTSLVVFGDSYSDNGVRSYTPPVAEENTEASTGGRVWPSYVQQYTSTNLYDYAVSGAMCDERISNSPRNGIAQDQLPTFLSDLNHKDNTTDKPALTIPKDETVYAIWIGTNDLGYSGFITEVQPKGMPLTYFTDCVYTQLDRLYEVGARRFVLMNIAPLDLSPQHALPENGGLVNSQFWKDKEAYDGGNMTRSSEKMRQYLTMVNEVFEVKTPVEVQVKKRYRGSRVAVYDVHGLITDIWHNPAEYLNGTAPYNVTGSVYRCGSDCDDNAVRDSYLWYDDLHPSEQTDRVIAREFVEVVKGRSKWATYWRN
ncbi:SGNH hydrolase-type esterase domain-containing protein [Aspergillus karnatakaensis]|uniref:SGNH/GDSL hydrolase family protein n=1 Tax=Aspergillus karnatakaensis TaxID=1810916 RepID=UPI003CCE2532